MNQEETKKKFILQNDLPVNEDFFNGGHTKVAESILKIIRENKTSITIGLEGDWGSGKSTVLKIVEARINSNEECKNNIKIVLFDAWAHEGDPLRRVFLEKIIDSLSGYWLPSKKWNYIKKTLTGKYTKTITKNTPFITKSGFAVLVSSFFVPLGIVMVREAINRGDVLFNCDYKFSWLLFIGIVFSFLPLLVGLIMIAKNNYKNRKENDVATTQLTGEQKKVLEIKTNL